MVPIIVFKALDDFELVFIFSCKGSKTRACLEPQRRNAGKQNFITCVQYSTTRWNRIEGKLEWEKQLKFLVTISFQKNM